MDCDFQPDYGIKRKYLFKNCINLGDFRNLNVWKESRKLVSFAYYLTQKPEFKNDFRLVNQIRGAAISIASNIAEGEEMGSNNQSVRFFRYAKASASELQTQFILAYDVGYLTKEEFEKSTDKCRKVSSMLHNLIKFRKP